MKLTFASKIVAANWNVQSNSVLFLKDYMGKSKIVSLKEDRFLLTISIRIAFKFH